MEHKLGQLKAISFPRTNLHPSVSIIPILYWLDVRTYINTVLRIDALGEKSVDLDPRLPLNSYLDFGELLLFFMSKFFSLV